MENTEVAKVIYQRLLDEMGRAIEDRDFDTFRQYVHLPHRMLTGAQETIIQTATRLRGVFQRMCLDLQKQDVRGLTRICTVADFVTPGLIRGSHETWLLTPHSEIKQSYVALSTLRLDVTGAWQVCDSEYDGPGKILPCSVMGHRNEAAQEGPHR